MSVVQYLKGKAIWIVIFEVFILGKDLQAICVEKSFKVKVI